MEKENLGIKKILIEKTKKILDVPKMHFYTLTSEVWDAIFEDCSRAQKSIYIEMFILLHDTSETHNFFQLFKDKAKQGVKVVLLLDALGSLGLDNDEIKLLRQSGIEVKFFIKWLNFSHRKLIIIDEKKVFVGGVNIKKAFKNWTDLMISIEMVHASLFLKSFAGSYALAGGKDEHILNFLKKSVTKSSNLGLIDHIPILGYFRLKNYLHRKLINAQTSVTIVTPYLVPPVWLEDVLKKLVLKGVRVSVIIPAHSDDFLGRVASKYFFKRFTSYGIHVLLLPYMNHGKAILVDDQEAMVGSGNIDRLSLGRNNEIGVFFSESTQVEAVKTIFQKWIDDSKEYTVGVHTLKWYERISFPIVWMLFPFL